MTIRDELCKAAEIKEKRGENPQEFYARLTKAIGELANAEWDKLSDPATDWFNLAVDKMNEKQEVPGFPDEKPVEPEPAAGGRRRARAAEPAADYKPALKDKVVITTKRGKEYKGEIVSLDDKGLMLAVNDNEKDDVDLDFEFIDKIIPQGGSVAAPADEPAEPEVGDTVQVETMRGKVIMGVITEMGEKDLVLKDSTGEEHELGQDRLKSLIVKAKGAGAAAPAGRRRATTAATTTNGGGTETEAEKAKRSSNPRGVSVGGRIRELMCGNPSITQDAVSAQLKKDGLEFRDTSVNMIYKDTAQVLKLLKDAGKLK